MKARDNSSRCQEQLVHSQFLNVSPLIVLKQVIIDFNLFLLFKCQTQWESTNSFWSNVELEKVEKDEQLLNRKMDQAEVF